MQKNRFHQPPEYLNNEEYDASGDIWQLGLILYHLLMFIPLFDVKKEGELRRCIDQNIFIDQLK